MTNADADSPPSRLDFAARSRPSTAGRPGPTQPDTLVRLDVEAGRLRERLQLLQVVRE